ncbi:hypothetical protein HPB49_005707 [Dermacentor silvarum]|uniref:Uncharacterized protein n=1 Tax=Dermacentor silvarum TaxID=543639 RepID=A0ACB8C7D5_DERSI|nr:hypothetical protein HPB49_005707 [Dermacentor silvarum]
MAASTPVTGYDPASHRMVTMDVIPADQDVPTEHEYLEDMIQLWQRKKRKSPAKTPKLKGAPAASQPAAAGMSTHLLPGSAPNSSPPQVPRKPSWRPRYTPRIGRDNLIIVLKPRASFDLKTVLPSECAGDGVRALLGDCSTADLLVWPVWGQNVLVCSLTSIPIAQRLLDDIMLPVGDQQFPFRGHAKASGDICRGVINIDPAASSSSIKPNLEWPKDTILAARKFGDSNMAVVTFEGPKVPRFIFYRCQVAYVRLYKKTVPVCSCCGTIGHRATACPSPKPGFWSRCGSQVPTTPEGLAQHECQARCILCTGPHKTGTRGCPGKYRKPIKPSLIPGLTTTSYSTSSPRALDLTQVQLPVQGPATGYSGTLPAIRGSTSGQQAPHPVCTPGRQANVSANARSATPTLRVQQPKLQTEASAKVGPPTSRVQQPKLQTDTTTTENETLLEKRPENESRKLFGLEQGDQIQNSEPNRHRSFSSLNHHRNVETDHHRQIASRNHSPENSICTASATRSYLKAPTSPTRRLTFIDRSRFLSTTTPQNLQDMPKDCKLDNIQNRRNVCNSTGTVVTLPCTTTPTYQRTPSWYLHQDQDGHGQPALHVQVQVDIQTPLAAPLVNCTQSREVWASVPAC